MICPEKVRQNKGDFFVEGNCLMGLIPLQAHQMAASTIERVLLIKWKSAGWNPSSSIVLNDAVMPVTQMLHKFIVRMAKSLLSLIDV